MVIMPASDGRKFGENFQWHLERVRSIAEILDEHGCRLGLEFIGPQTLRIARPYGFLHSMDGMLAFAQAVGTGPERRHWAQAEALEHLEEAIHYRPSDVEVSTRAAGLSLAMGDPERALLHAQNAADVDPERASHHLLCSRVMRRLGDFEAANAALGRAVALEGDAPEVVAEREKVKGKTRG